MIILVIIVGVLIAAISIIVGLVKGFSGTKSWAIEYLLTAVIAIPVFSLINFSSSILGACLALGVIIILLVAFAFCSNLLKSHFCKQISKARLRSYYEHYGEREEAILEIRDALERGDNALYEELSSRKIPEDQGAAGVLDRIFGAVNLFIKAMVACTLIVIAVLMVLDFTQLSFVQNALSSLYSSSIWGLISRFALDLFVIGLVQCCIKAGYRTGVFNTLWILFIIVLVAGAAYVAYNLAFKVTAFTSLAENFTVSEDSFLSSISGYLSTIIKWAICAAIFVVEFIVILIIGRVGGGIIDRATDEKVVTVVDGILGALVFTVVAVVILMAVGGLMYTFNDFAIMDVFNKYCYHTSGDTTGSTALFTYFYDKNPLNNIESFAALQDKISGIFNK